MHFSGFLESQKCQILATMGPPPNILGLLQTSCFELATRRLEHMRLLQEHGCEKSGEDSLICNIHERKKSNESLTSLHFLIRELV